MGGREFAGGAAARAACVGSREVSCGGECVVVTLLCVTVMFSISSLLGAIAMDEH